MPSSSSECIQVVIRCRPLTSKEIANGNEEVVKMYNDDDKGEVITLTNRLRLKRLGDVSQANDHEEEPGPPEPGPLAICLLHCL